MMESSGRLVTRSKYYTFFGALLNLGLLAALVLFPLLHPEALPKSATTALLLAPAPPPASPPPPSPARAHPVVREISEFLAPSRIPKQIRMAPDTAQPVPSGTRVQGMEAAGAAPAGLFDLVGGPALPVVQAPLPKKVAVSQGVMAGNILVKPEPTYPAIAKAARIQGTVILSATISKSGTIENLTVVSGPQMLVPAAVDAVHNWRYRPYLLNGQPVEVQTLVNVTFTLGG